MAAAKACLFKFPVSFKYLGFQTVAAYTAVGRGADGVDLSGAYYTVGYEAAAPLLRPADVLFFKAVVVNVRELYIVEFHAPDFLQLFLDAAPHFQR